MKTDYGLSLIEVLIALLVISIGLLGVAGLQVSSLRITHQANLSTLAILAANDMAERMRANPFAVHHPNDAIDNLFADIKSTDINCDSKPKQRCSANYRTKAQVCTAQQMARFDIHDWLCGENTDHSPGVFEVLPNASASITCFDINDIDSDACSPGSEHMIKVSWLSRNNTGKHITKNVKLSVTP